MIGNDQELQVMLDRIARFQAQLAHLRRTEDLPQNFRRAASGYLAELDRMQLEVREYLEIHPSEMEQAAA